MCRLDNKQETNSGLNGHFLRIKTEIKYPLNAAKTEMTP
jgi:hypothetical protein